MKHRLLRIVFALTVVIGIALLPSCNKEGLDSVSITGECTDDGETSAKLFGWCNKDGVEGPSVKYGIEYSATDLTTNAWPLYAEGKDSKNKYSCQATNLRPNTLYYYRAFTYDNNRVTSYGEVKTFKTLDFTASVTTLEATDITEIRATLRGSVKVNSKEDLSVSCWFIFSDTETELDAIKISGHKYRGLLSEDGTFYFAYEPRVVEKFG